MNRIQAIARLEAHREIADMHLRQGAFDRHGFLVWRDDVASTMADADRFAPDFGAKVRAVDLGDSGDVDQAIASVTNLIDRAILVMSGN